MNDTAERQALVTALAAAAAAVVDANAAIDQFDARPENNVFATLEEAAGELEDELRDKAHKDCEGSYNCGAPQYHRRFMVDGVTYVGTLAVEYNRHDKTYYYVDEAKFTYERLALTEADAAADLAGLPRPDASGPVSA